MNDPTLPHCNPNVNVHTRDELMSLSSSITQLTVDCDCCNEEDLNILNICQWPLLSVIEIGSYSFKHVDVVELNGLSRLERVVIGRNSFSKQKSSIGNYPAGRFYLKDCEKVRELKIGRYSFNDYGVCAIENDASLEEIEMGEVTTENYNFYYASLSLKSRSERME